MDLIELIEKYKQAKQEAGFANAKVTTLAGDIVWALKQARLDSAGNNEVGKVTAVYHKEYIVEPDGMKRLDPINTIIQKLGVALEEAQHQKRVEEEALFIEGLAKEDKRFSHIRFTQAK